MYEKYLPGNIDIRKEFADGVTEFINWAKTQFAFMAGEKIHCPCSNCRNNKFKSTEEVTYDLYRKGFVKNYYNWTSHGEPLQMDYEHPMLANNFVDQMTNWNNYEQLNWDQRMVFAAAGPVFHPQRNAYNESHTNEAGSNSNDERLYASNTTIEHMSWHATHETESGVMCHPSDAEAWKHFNETHPYFALEPRNVRLDFYADAFAPHGQYGKSYSCWPVIITPYNLPLGMCMKSEYIFLSLIIPGPANTKRLIDVYLQPLIEELVQLWQVGAQTYDASKKVFFLMRAALMWTINDFPAYGMLSSWSTAGIMGYNLQVTSLT
ncbi:UNVERIFIED_CONTAM: hypothetical protein Sradi_1763700 [Sesamum radiatum]|uniref:Transposase-associated domain-containing protein n=1 Tax=Sesamum radiatum TaxID=300843 RepID=A0AAW2TUT9_SESRA